MLSSTPSRPSNHTNQTAGAASSLNSPLNNSLNNILKCSPSGFLQKSNATKSNSSTILSGHDTNNLNEPNKLHASPGVVASATPNISETKAKSSSSNDNINSGLSNKIYGSSLLCYQNVPPPSPTNSMANDATNKSTTTTSNSPKTSDDSKTPKHSNSSSATTLAALLPGDSTTLPVKKRTKLRHRLSDVGSWGLRKKDRAHKYRSMNIESLEVLGDPVIEDMFFVSLFHLLPFSYNIISSFFLIINCSKWGVLFQIQMMNSYILTLEKFDCRLKMCGRIFYFFVISGLINRYRFLFMDSLQDKD